MSATMASAGVSPKIPAATSTTPLSANLPMPPTSFLRPLDATETFWNSFHDVGRVMILSVISLLSSHPISLSQLKEAASLLANRHEVLSSRISTDDSTSPPQDDYLGRCRWAPMAAPVIDCQEARLSSPSTPSPSSSQWLEAMAQEQRFGFDVWNGPLWRMRLIPSQPCYHCDAGTGVIVDSCQETNTRKSEQGIGGGGACRFRTYILGCFHHCIMDGVSRQRFWNELCCSLSVIYVRDSRLIRPVVQADSSPLLPRTRFPDSVQTCMPPNLRMRILSQLFPTFHPTSYMVNAQRRIMGPIRNPFSYFFPRKYCDQTVTAHTSIIPIWVPVNVTDKLLKAAKRSSVTLNGVITAVAALAMARLIWQRKRLTAKLNDSKSENFEATFPIQLPPDQLNGDSPFVALNPRDSDLFPLPLHTPAHITRNAYRPWDAALAAPSREPSAVNCVVASRARSRPASSAGWSMPLHMYMMHAVSCRRWLPCYTEESDKAAMESFWTYLENYLKHCLEDTSTTASEHSRAEQLSETSAPPQTGNSSVEGRSESPSTELSSQADTLDASSAPLTPIISPRKLCRSPSPPHPRLTADIVESVAAQGGPKLVGREGCPPGLGSYAILMPKGVWVTNKCEVDRDFWAFARRNSRHVHRCVDRSSPTKASLKWQIMSGFIKAASKNKSVLRRLCSPVPRPSSFMISNGGRWDVRPMERMMRAVTDLSTARPQDATAVVDNHMEIQIESSWSCVAQHEAGVNMFCHNIVTLNGRMCWSLQYHTNLTNKRLATEYGKQVLYVINQLVK
eukprot:GHVS01028818.1.p1 GENE.GHVS01028818.1~~GHVS01028818.1.p1  ORF type:complete len:791 (+),score=85.47 GHVS01028818.1:152-2524(+)